MAASSIANLFSFFTPSKPPPPPPSALLKFPPPHLSTSASSPSSSSTHSGRAPLVFSSEAQSSPSCSSDVMSVVCPSLAYANTMFFSATYNVQVVVEENEPEEKLLGRFRREVIRSGILQECRRRRFHENSQDEKKRRTRDAARRNRRRRPQLRNGPQDTLETPENKKEDDDDDDDDNWDLPEGDLPY